MKKVFSILVGVVLLTSCNEAERHLIDYKYKHEERMLDLEYRERIIYVKNRAQLRLDILELDSILAISNEQITNYENTKQMAK